ncbi:MAG: PIG-L family deacetylase [Crocinitomicaceae bacterium]|nr:PIG-L family deacetylase [Crocinitomicaceae bacterium]
MHKIILIFAILLVNASWANKNPAEIYQNLLKFKSMKRVLYIAAHPDDENTRALANFSLGENAETAYLSLTRGDGGQNLIGSELSEDLGILRTQELLAARSYDKANQFFTRAVDFGYSKSPEESMEKWGKDLILSDVVLVIRKFKPDVIITRFPPDERGGHGHHTASAVLAIEGLEKAADPNFEPEQVKLYGTWKASAVYWNSSSWWDDSLPTKSKDNPKYLVQDIGGYNSLLGMSYNEIGTIARSQHKCQGFGAIIERGSRIEYFEHLAGEQLTNFFQKEHHTWSDLINKDFEKELNQIVNDFDFIHPEKNIASLFKIRSSVLKMPNSYLKSEKLNRINQIIIDCAGLYMEATSEDFAQSRDKQLKSKLTFLVRSDANVVVNYYWLTDKDIIDMKSANLTKNEPFSHEFDLNKTSLLSNPYWLLREYQNTYQVENKALLGFPENPPSFVGNVSLSINGEELEVQLPFEFVERDPAYGERRREVVASPLYTANFEQKIALFQPGNSKTVKIRFHSFADKLDTKVQLLAPEGWTVEPSTIQLSADRKHQEVFQEVKITASSNSKRGKLSLIDDQKNQVHSYTEIAYDHIPKQVIFKLSQIELIKLDAKTNPKKIAYIKGVEDAVPDGIRELGLDLKLFEVEELADLDLSKFDVVVLGIRIYNVKQELKNFDEKLFQFVENGGRVIMQYNTASRWVKEQSYGPKPFELGRKRVTEEDAEVTFLEKEHPVLNNPNKISKKDFENWVQERGLYFAETWDESYIPILAWNDKGEEPTKGSLLILDHGKGQFIYTGISFFRELPNGVEGAFKLIANLLSYE